NCTQADCLTSFSGKQVVVIGCWDPYSQGAALATALQQAGANVTCGTKHMGCTYGGVLPRPTYPVYYLDVLDPASIQTFFSKVGYIDYLLVTPGISTIGWPSEWN